MPREFGGVWPAMLTPLDESGEPSPEAIDRLVELFVKQGLDGLYILGSTGQWPLLTVTQRRRVAEHVVTAAAGRIPVMVHVGAVATADAVALARHAAEIGADAVSAVAPIYYPAGADVTFEHYRRIGAAGGLPLYV
jgi:N-acetylneuraminate lyase